MDVRLVQLVALAAFILLFGSVGLISARTERDARRREENERETKKREEEWGSCGCAAPQGRPDEAP